LELLIEKLNESGRRIFSEVFEQIRKNFQHIFQVIFQGGFADLKLEGDDPLEAGIEIIARPFAGRKTLPLASLSGGQKAMTTIALMFAVFRIKPTPFVILDEVDAPLDEANIGRFINLIKQFKHENQFLVVSHNRKTMGVGDSIYGITMNSEGISIRVGVDFQKLVGEKK